MALLKLVTTDARRGIQGEYTRVARAIVEPIFHEGERVWGLRLEVQIFKDTATRGQVGSEPLHFFERVYPVELAVYAEHNPIELAYLKLKEVEFIDAQDV